MTNTQFFLFCYEQALFPYQTPAFVLATHSVAFRFFKDIASATSSFLNQQYGINLISI